MEDKFKVGDLVRLVSEEHAKVLHLTFDAHYMIQYFYVDPKAGAEMLNIKCDDGRNRDYRSEYFIRVSFIREWLDF